MGPFTVSKTKLSLLLYIQRLPIHKLATREPICHYLHFSRGSKQLGGRVHCIWENEENPTVCDWHVFD